MRTVNIGIVGLGTVGGGVARIINRHKEDFLRHQGVDINLKLVVDRYDGLAKELGLSQVFSDDWHDLVNDPDIDIVVELVGGTGVAHDIIIESLKAGKNVVTANKALMASCGQEIFEAAESTGVEIAFGASVGGGIPIIGPLKHSLTGNEISEVLGIVNGTTNYMLTRMDEDGLTYDAALKEAQERGFAEANPTADVDGLDAAAKIAIMASIAFNSRVTIDDVDCEGIRSISPSDLKAARDMGYAVKLLAVGRKVDGAIDVRVAPTMIPLSHQLASVNGVYNAIYVTGDAVGDVMFFGMGAGSGPAASAVVGDIIEVARRIAAGYDPLVGCTCTDSLPFVDPAEMCARYYIRLKVSDTPGTLAATAEVFATCDVSIASMIQRDSKSGEAELSYVTHEARVKDVMTSIDVLRAVKQVHEVSTVIRIEGRK